jgi:hypothetical protein
MVARQNFLPMNREDVQQEPPDQTALFHKSKHDFSSLRKFGGINVIVRNSTSSIH